MGEHEFVEHSPYYAAYIEAWNGCNAAYVGPLTTMEEILSYDLYAEAEPKLPTIKPDELIEFCERTVERVIEFERPKPNLVWSFECETKAVSGLMYVVFRRDESLREQIVKALVSNDATRPAVVHCLSNSYFETQWPIDLVLHVIAMCIEHGLEHIRPSSPYDTLQYDMSEALTIIGAKEYRDSSVKQTTERLIEEFGVPVRVPGLNAPAPTEEEIKRSMEKYDKSLGGD